MSAEYLQGYSQFQILSWYQHTGYPQVIIPDSLKDDSTEKKDSTQSDFGPRMGRVKIPAWDGKVETLKSYKVDVMLVEQNIAVRDRHLLAGRLLEEFTGVAKKYLLVEPSIISDSRLTHSNRTLGLDSLPH